MRDLDSLIDPTLGWQLQDAKGINDLGQITGTGLIGDEFHTFLLTPVPEPANATLFIAGLICLLLSRQFRIDRVRHQLLATP
jgi:hypothetical protein